MGASASTPLPAAGTASAPTTPKAELDDLRFFGHAPAAVEKDHTWFYEVVSAALLASSRGGKIANYMVQTVAAGEFAATAPSSADPATTTGHFTLAQHACWRKYRAVVTAELVATCKSFDYSPRDILSALERHVDRASPSDLSAIQGLQEVTDLLAPYQDFENFARMMAVRSIGQRRKQQMKSKHEKHKVPRPPPPRRPDRAGDDGDDGDDGGEFGQQKARLTPNSKTTTQPHQPTRRPHIDIDPRCCSMAICHFPLALAC